MANSYKETIEMKALEAIREMESMAVGTYAELGLDVVFDSHKQTGEAFLKVVETLREAKNMVREVLEQMIVEEVEKEAGLN